MERSQRNPIMELYHSVSWYAFFRGLFIIALTMPGIVTLYIFNNRTEQIKRDLIIGGVAMASNLLFWILILLWRHHRRMEKTLAVIWTGFDIALVSGLIFLNGAVDSRSQILYTIPILTASGILGRYAGLITAGLSSIAYSAVIILDYRGIIHSVGALVPTDRYNLPFVVNTIAFYCTIFFVVGFVANHLTHKLTVKTKEAEVNLDALIQAQEIAKVGSWNWDLSSGDIILSSELYKIMGLDNKNRVLTYEDFIASVKPMDRPSLNSEIHKAIRNKSRNHIDFRVLHPDNSSLNVHAEVIPVIDDSGKVIGITGTAQDITNNMQLDEAKKDFVSLASHQLRTPATVVKVFLGMIKEQHAGEINKEQSIFINKAYEANERQLEIIDNLLSVAAIESGRLNMKKEVVELGELIKQSMLNHKSSIDQRKHRISFKKERDKIYVRGDRSYLMMAMDNLISNAIKYTPDKGKIKVSLVHNKRSVVLDISDSGIGIPKNQQEIIFQKFTRADQPESGHINGSGLGLYLVDNIVKFHRGTVSVKSSPGQGTNFKIRMPIYSPKQRLSKPSKVNSREVYG